MRHIIDIHHDGGGAWAPQVRGDEHYRFRLSLRWDQGPVLGVVGLYPTPGAVRRWDAGLWRLGRIAKSWGYAGLAIANLNARIVESSDELADADDPVGPGNDDELRQLAAEHDFVLLAWGEQAEPARACSVAAQLWRELTTHGGALGVLGWAANGQPCALARGRTAPIVPHSLTAGAHPGFVDVDQHWANLFCGATYSPVAGVGGGRYA